MMRLSLIFLTFVISILLSLLLHVEEETHADAEVVSQGTLHDQFQYSADAVSLMQGTNLHVERLGSKGISVQRTSAATREKSKVETKIETIETKVENRKEEKAGHDSPEKAKEAPAQSGLQHLQNLQGRLKRGFGSLLQTQQAMISAAKDRLATQSAAPVIILFLLLTLTGVAIVLILAPKGNGSTNLGNASRPTTPMPRHTAAIPQHTAVVMGSDAVLPSRQPSFAASGTPFARTPAFAGGDSYAGVWQSISRPSTVMSSLSIPGLFRSGPSPSQDSLVVNSVASLDPRVPTFQVSQYNLEGVKSVPPALCPTLVLPVCEARFGVNFDKLGMLSNSGEGEIDIVGLSGNPLLRAALRKAPTGRRLEISMPEAGSAPRATVGPSAQGPRFLELRALKGQPYGTLEMNSTGACHVIKDGARVLSIDGDPNSLQLSFQSGQGTPLASVRCSTEFFGGVEHLEVRVEPGVDTVLVLSCALAVMLLSPFSPRDS